MERKLHILHVEEFFIPNLGYQLNLLSKYMALEGHKITILTTELDKITPTQKVYLHENIGIEDEQLKKDYQIDVIRIPVKKVFSSRAYWDNSVFKKVKELNPDVIYLHGNDTLISIQYLLFHHKKNRIPLVMDNHMLEVASKNKFSRFFRLFYKLFITPIIVKNKIPVIRVVDDPFVNNAYNIPKQLTPFISFGSDIELFKPDPIKKNEYRKKLGIDDDEFVFIYAGKLSEDKDGMFFAESIREKILPKSKKIVFLILGTTSGEYGQKVEQAFSESENRILRFPLQRYKDLPQFFQAADFALIPSAASLTFYDMQACGLPILWSDIPVNVNRTKENNGFLFRNKDKDDFRTKIAKCANMSDKELLILSENSTNYISNNFSYYIITKKYLNSIFNLLN